jgi:four helix bundle protein
MQNYKDLKVWEKAHRLALEIYKASKGFPKEEQFNITSQIRRAVISIPSNIAEGCGKFTSKDFGSFQIALGSTNGVEYLILFSSELGLLDQLMFETFSKEIGEIRGMLIALIKKVRA